MLRGLDLAHQGYDFGQTNSGHHGGSLQGVLSFVGLPILNAGYADVKVPHHRMKPLQSEVETLAYLGLFTESFSFIKFGEISAV